jgi:hypothetical protein
VCDSLGRIRQNFRDNGDAVKLSVLEIVMQFVVVVVVATVAAVMLTPSGNAVSMLLYWLGFVALSEVGFFVVW